ncbi:CDP-diacylglycerol--glycerol-3-phosphate 3-phosphatidyltransferase [Brevibacillus ginsengisoli]|uniref:CDP-diacylglycerol--glycerol-3-phosphate 3-phosphatidyltransferase n=1 Tax=Brevibacillus ginsengisoli TaxID=363854 RepID=UPI003CF0FDAF
MNVPNALTVFRIMLIPIYLYIFFSDRPYHLEISYFILIFAGITDIVDGYIARTYKLITDFGKMMDPLADKLMMLTVIISFFLTDRISLWAALFFFVRDVSMIITAAIFHFRGKKTVPANAFGKLTTVLFYLAFTLLMFRSNDGELVLWIVIALSFVTSAIYLVKFRLLNRVL